MIKLDQQKTKSLVALHGWSAIGLGLLLYAVVITGTVAVFAEEILHWSLGAKNNHVSIFEADLDKAIATLAPQVDAKYHDDIDVGETARGNVRIFFHTHALNPKGDMDSLGVEFTLAPDSLSVLSKREGFSSDLFWSDGDRALSRFLVSIHTELHLPRPWGLLLTGILGFAMLVAAVSGFMMHRHLIADAFVVRRNSSAILKQRDLHTVAGTWGLPFAFILAVTGSFFSFAGAFGVPAMAMVAFSGDQEALIRTLVGEPETQSTEVRPTASINHIVQRAYEKVNALPQSLTLSHYNRGDAKVLLSLPPAESDLEPITLEYSGVSGEFIRQKPSLGTTLSMGSVAFAVIVPLHFGNFAGLLSKFVWGALGFASCYVIVSGFSLWLRRREENSRWKIFERIAIIIIWGLPIAMLASAMGYFVGVMNNTPNVLVSGMFLASAAVVICGSVIPRNMAALKRYLLWVIAVLCVLLPIVRLFAGGVGWLNAIMQGDAIVVMVDILLVCLAVFTGLHARNETKILNSLQQLPELQGAKAE